jgi:hypothetical protein
MCWPAVAAVAGAAGAISQGQQAAAAGRFNAQAGMREGATQAALGNRNADAVLQEGETAAQLALRNEATLRQRADERLQVGAADAGRQETINRLRMGEGRAAAAASGLTMEGSPLAVLAFNAGQLARDVETIRLQAGLDARDMVAEAEMERWRSDVARTNARSQASLERWRGAAGQASSTTAAALSEFQGRAAATGGYIRAGTTLLSAGADWAKDSGLFTRNDPLASTPATRRATTGRLAGSV